MNILWRFAYYDNLSRIMGGLGNKKGFESNLHKKSNLILIIGSLLGISTNITVQLKAYKTINIKNTISK